MSYARSPSEGDVYVIGTHGKNEPLMHWECISCELVTAERSEGYEFGPLDGKIVPSGKYYYSRGIFYAHNPSQMYYHLKMHVAVGQTVPQRAFDRLQDENVEWQRERDEELAALIKEKPNED